MRNAAVGNWFMLHAYVYWSASQNSNVYWSASNRTLSQSFLGRGKIGQLFLSQYRRTSRSINTCVFWIVHPPSFTLEDYDMRLSPVQFIKDQRNPVPPVVHANLAGKTVIVTGANIGLGFEASKHFARMNPKKLILACRSKERGEAALKSP